MFGDPRKLRIAAAAVAGAESSARYCARRRPAQADERIRDERVQVRVAEQDLLAASDR